MHSVFTYPVDRIEVDGQPFGPHDGTVDFADDFNDGNPAPFFGLVGTVTESGGMLHLQDPGFHFPGFDIDTSIAFHSTGFAVDGDGDVCSTARWPAGPIAMNTFVLAGLGNHFTPESILIGLVRTDAPTAAGMGIPAGLAIMRFRFEVPDVVAVSIDEGDITGDVHARACLNDATNLATASISLDGGTTFLSPFPSTPTFEGSLTPGVAAGTIFTTTTTSTSTSSTSSSTSSTSSSSTSTSSSTTSSTSSTSSSTSNTTSSSTSSTSTSSTSTTAPASTTTTSSSTSSTSTTTLPPLCTPTPATGCRLATVGASTVQLKDHPSDDAKDQFKWKWAKGGATDLADFADPVNGAARYAVCLYDASGRPLPLMQMDVLPGGTCPSSPCWKATGTTGFSFKSKAATPHGLNAVKLKAGLAGKASVQAKGKSLLLPMPALGLTLPVTVQLVIGDGPGLECWQTTYTTQIKNDASQFKAKGP
jgi:hypothetical protein